MKLLSAHIENFQIVEGYFLRSFLRDSDRNVTVIRGLRTRAERQLY